MRPHIFRQSRKALKLTQAELAAALGICTRQVGRYEAGRAVVPARTVLALEALTARRPKRRRSA